MRSARFSQLFIPTLKEAPADAQVASHKLLVRAGFIRQLGAGIYDYLPLARRSLARIERIVREEMDAIGAQEFHLPALHPAEIWKESGRWEVMGENMFRLKDRKGGDYCLGMTHEEVFTAIARDEVRSYRQLPQVWYQIQTKFRDEPRPKSGLLRVRQFTMKDAYSFDVDRAGLDRSYEDQRRAYEKIFTRSGPESVAVQAHSGALGGSASSALMVKTAAADEKLVLAVVRGDQELNEAKLLTATGAQVVRPAHPEEIPPLMGAHAGSLGAVGFSKAPVLVDGSLADRKDMVTGANEDGFHVRGVDVRRDVLSGPQARLADL